MAQFLRPDSTVTATSFTNGFAAIDESAASDADFAYGANNIAAVLEVGLSNPGGTPGSGTTTVRYRIAKTKTGVVDGTGNSCTVTAALYQGTTLIAADTARTATGTWTEYSWAPNVGSVSDWNDLRLRFTTSASGGTSANRRGGAVSWAEIEAPDAQSAITGTMAATESGSDSFAGSGTVADPSITGTMAATDSGPDTASASGSVSVSGSLSASDSGSDTVSASGSVAISGALSASDTGSDNLSALGQVSLGGALAATEAGSDTGSGTGSVEVSGSLAGSEDGADTFAGSGSVEGNGITGALDATEAGSDVSELAGAVEVSGACAATEGGSDAVSMFAELLVNGMLDADDLGPDSFLMSRAGACRKTAKRPSSNRVTRMARPRNVSRGAR